MSLLSKHFESFDSVKNNFGTECTAVAFDFQSYLQPVAQVFQLLACLTETLQGYNSEYDPQTHRFSEVSSLDAFHTTYIQ